MGAGTVAKVLVTTVLAAIPLAISVWALLDAAHRPEWAFALARRSRTAWVAATGLGILFCGPGVLVAVWYLVKVRPGVAAAESGRIT
jgi:hypothetical protein